jgi:hypothetical protein
MFEKFFVVGFTIMASAMFVGLIALYVQSLQTLGL